MIEKVITHRAYFYPIVAALVALLGSYGVLDDQTSALWLALAAGVLGTGVATVFTTPPSRAKTPEKPVVAPRTAGDVVRESVADTLTDLPALDGLTDSAGRPLVPLYEGRHRGAGE